MLRLRALRQVCRYLRREPSCGSTLRMAGRTFLDCVVRGHLTMESFWCMHGEFPMLANAMAMSNDGWLVQLAQARLRETVEQGEEASGCLAGYVQAQMAHLEGCVPCQVSVAEGIRQDAHLAQEIDAVIAPLRDAEPPTLSAARQERIMRNVFAQIERERGK